MKSLEQILNLFWLFLGTAICIFSLTLRLYGPSGPESGLVPFLSGLIIGSVGLYLFLSKSTKQNKVGDSKFWEFSTVRNRVILVLFGFCAMAYLLPELGFVISSVLITTFLLRVLERQNILKAIAIALVCCFAVYALFGIILKIILPVGPFGF